MKSRTGLRLNQIKRHAISIAISLLLLGFVLVADGHAQSHRVRSRPTRSRAQQALMHTGNANSRAAKIPAGYRPAHLRLASEEAEIVGQFGEQIIGEEIIDGGYTTDGYVEGAPLEQEVFVDNGAPVEEFGELSDSWDQSEVYDEGYEELYDECGCGTCLGGGGGIGGLGGGIGTFGFNLQDASIFAGVQAFRGPGNLGSTGSFGFHEGFNIGVPLSLFPNSGAGFQVGARFLQSNLNGADFTQEQRNQTFVTLGFFRRSDFGLQGGLAVDILRDLWYDAVDLTQIRGEISWLFPSTHEWGFWFTAGDSDDTALSPIDNTTTLNFTTTQLNAFFYRRRMSLVPGGQLSLYAGFSGDADGLVGTKAYLPLTGALALQTDFIYLTPEQSTASGGTLNESWNLGLSLVWRLGNDSQCVNPSYYRPMFEVADNGTFMVDQF